MTQGEAWREIEATIRGMFRKFVDHEPGGVESSLHEECRVWDVSMPELIQARGALTMSIGPMVTSVWGDTGSRATC